MMTTLRDDHRWWMLSDDHDSHSRALMAKAEWFRRTSWTPADRAEFAARLKRSRSPFRKSQYLRIQALHLQEQGVQTLTEAAVELLDQLIAEWPDPSQLASAYVLRAECLVDLGRPRDALDDYIRSFDVQRREPNWRNDAHLGFGELVVALRRAELYDLAIAVLDEFGQDEPFPAQQYRIAAIRSLIADELGDEEAARESARRALAAAARTESPFRYHRTLGLVRSVQPDVHARLIRLAS